MLADIRGKDQDLVTIWRRLEARIHCCDYQRTFQAAGRKKYSEGFRHFVIDLVGPGGSAEPLSLECLADLADVPLGTLKSWLAIPATKPPIPKHGEPLTAEAGPTETGSARVVGVTLMATAFATLQVPPRCAVRQTWRAARTRACSPDKGWRGKGTDSDRMARQVSSHSYT